MSRKYLQKMKWKKSLALTLALVMSVSMLPVQNIRAAEQPGEAKMTQQQQDVAEEIEYEQIDIRTAEEFVSFAKKCYVDAWSKDKYVSLKADIDLSGVEFETIPVFNGIFDGAGHTISGFDYVGDGYVVGLFRYIESSGLVQNLKVEGNISSENEKECIGSICGINYGTIRSCTFQGTVSGRDTVGGIVGINESTGTLSGCSVKGRVTGYYSTGGIVGINHGVINSCTNRAGVNDDSAWVEEDDEMGGVNIIKNLTSNDDNEIYSGVDTGGIAGFSDGMISKCTNAGTVGYEHTGYNIGGIAGRQSGVVSLCTNNGTIYGRKDIGGIVGQMEPFIEVDEAESLRNAINKLHDLIEKTIDDMDAAEDAVKGDVDTMQAYADSAIDTGDELISQLSDFVDDNVDEVNTVSERMGHIMDMMPDILNNVSAAGDSMSKLNDVLKQLSKDMDVLGKLDDSSYEETDYNRISLLSTVGGSLTTDTTDPEVNDTVTITVAPDDGYQLKQDSLAVVDADGKKVAVTPVSGKDNQYTFTMTKKNVKVSAQFLYKGTFLVKSTVGGRVTTSEDGNNVTFKATPSSGYEFKYYNVKGSQYTENADNEIVLDKTAYITDNTSVVVEAMFEKKNSTHRISVKSGTGGTASADSAMAAAGDTVTVRYTAYPNYKFNTMTVSGGTVSSESDTNLNERTFTMPACDVDVEVLFQNKYDNTDSQIFPESNVGGNVTVQKNDGGTRYKITIRPDNGYDVSETNAITFSPVSPSSSGTSTQTSAGWAAVADTVIMETQAPRAQEPEQQESSEQQESAEQQESSEQEEETEEAGEPSDGNENPDDENEAGEDASESSESSEETTETVESESEEEQQEGDISVNAVPASPVTKDQLDNSNTGVYTYMVDLGTDTNSYRAYVTFEKQPDTSVTYNITTASSTGGTVTVDKTSAEAGKKVYATPTAGDGYVLSKILLNGSSDGLQLESDGKRYSFTMPDQEVEITAQFEPVDIILKSNLSGNATYSGNAEGKVTINVKPDSAYTVKSITVTDASGKKLAVSKKQSGSYLYEFDLTTMSKAPCTVDISFAKQNKKQAVDTSKTNINEAIDELTKASENVQKSIDKIRNIVTKSDGSYKSWDELTSDEQDAVVAEILNLVDYLQDMSTAASAILSNLATIYNILSPYVSDAAQAAKKDIDQATDVIHSMLDSLKAANNGVKGIVNYMNAQPDIKFAKLGDEFDTTKENFHDQLKGLSESIKSLSDNAGSHSDIINEDLRQVNDQLNVVFNLLADRMVDVEQLSIEELYEDVDDDEIDSITTGRADACTNKGSVKGDINVGGIAGSMSIDDEDPEDSAAGSIEYEIGRRFITKCLVTGSVNEGYVTAKKDGAGGICGYMNHGIIIDSEAYGSVESTEGDFVGGICGESLTIIKRCYALCSVSGNQNVGGIAGYADTLKNCYAMANVQAENGRVGAIAGQVASYEEVDTEASEEPKVTGNYYVGDDTYGIDNISYIGVAEPVSYNDLLTVEQLPTQFWHLKVIYKIDDTYLGSEEVKYGAKLDQLSYPQIPEKEGFYGVWPDLSDQKMQGTLVVEAEYKDNVTVVQSSNGEQDDGEDTRQRPYALVENIFTEDTILNATISDGTPPAEAEGKQYVMYDVTLENSGIGESDSFALRLLNPYSDATVYGYQNGTWTKLESKTRGQYLQVMMTGTQECFCVVENRSMKMIMIGSIAAAAVVILLIVVIGKKRIQKKKNKQQKKPKKH